MIPFNDLLLFILMAFGLVITPGPNMLYLISRSIVQGRKAGIISLTGIITGFFFHIIMVSFGLTAVLFAVPMAYTILKSLGVLYLLYMVYQSVKPNSVSIFEAQKDLPIDNPSKLLSMGFLTSMLNPKVAVFYVSFFPQFIKIEHGSVLIQSLQLGFTQVCVSFSVNLLIVLTAAKTAEWFNKNPFWVRIQKWFMASVLTGLAFKMALDKGK